MLSEAHYEAALNYFYFLLMDEGASLHCALKTVRLVQNREKKEEGIKADNLLIYEMSRVLHKTYKRQRPRAGAPAKSDWKPPNVDAMAAWRDYLKRSDKDSAEALVLRYILGYPIKIIAEALQVPEGTIYFRIGRGLESYAGGRS